jgi:hypothetical protein
LSVVTPVVSLRKKKNPIAQKHVYFTDFSLHGF